MPVATHLEDLQETEEPLLEKILKSKDQEMTVGDLRMRQQRLVRKVSE
jgi:hypothetical protein